MVLNERWISHFFCTGVHEVDVNGESNHQPYRLLPTALPSVPQSPLHNMYSIVNVVVDRGVHGHQAIYAPCILTLHGIRLFHASPWQAAPVWFVLMVWMLPAICICRRITRSSSAYSLINGMTSWKNFHVEMSCSCRTFHGLAKHYTGFVFACDSLISVFRTSGESWI